MLVHRGGLTQEAPHSQLFARGLGVGVGVEEAKRRVATRKLVGPPGSCLLFMVMDCYELNACS